MHSPAEQSIFVTDDPVPVLLTAHRPRRPLATHNKSTGCSETSIRHKEKMMIIQQRQKEEQERKEKIWREHEMKMERVRASKDAEIRHRVEMSRQRQAARQTGRPPARPVYAFGSSTPRQLAYLDRLPTEQRIYDKKLVSPTNIQSQPQSQSQSQPVPASSSTKGSVQASHASVKVAFGSTLRPSPIQVPPHTKRQTKDVSKDIATVSECSNRSLTRPRTRLTANTMTQSVHVRLASPKLSFRPTPVPNLSTPKHTNVMSQSFTASAATGIPKAKVRKSPLAQSVPIATHRLPSRVTNINNKENATKTQNALSDARWSGPKRGKSSGMVRNERNEKYAASSSPPEPHSKRCRDSQLLQTQSAESTDHQQQENGPMPVSYTSGSKEQKDLFPLTDTNAISPDAQSQLTQSIEDEKFGQQREKEESTYTVTIEEEQLLKSDITDQIAEQNLENEKSARDDKLRKERDERKARLTAVMNRTGLTGTGGGTGSGPLRSPLLTGLLALNVSAQSPSSLSLGTTKALQKMLTKHGSNPNLQTINVDQQLFPSTDTDRLMSADHSQLRFINGNANSTSAHDDANEDLIQI